ncbi:competence type IV pilus minor pilin ComGF [Bacillus sp. V5-8f]|uniref:competence type IV pilus minor pilin ComGF n=1 Tax=Bacillus sp. V5-8f TaxID=2053044 RepID=UPI000C771F31|nr:competence type IV pilus minor pilin ComGF [Bacillus sp. V5-8f]PLT35246.1 hypothetical protein CUU64_04775 [Bacillus sp. V5-8f]
MFQFVILRKDNGFTLIEMLVSLSIFVLVSSFTAGMFTFFKTGIVEKSSINQKEWEVFISQLKQDVWMSTSRQVSGDRLYLMGDGDVILIEQYQDKVRRRLNGTGHELMLQNISRLEVETNGSLITVTIRDKQGKLFTRKLRPFVPEQRVPENG